MQKSKKQELRDLYPECGTFNIMRKKCDPGGLFRNSTATGSSPIRNQIDPVKLLCPVEESSVLTTFPLYEISRRSPFGRINSIRS